jgi:signal transduction histidine kinase
MRQPLAAIVVLAESPGGDERHRLGLIADQARWLARLVDDVLVDAADDAADEVDVTACAALAVAGAAPSTDCALNLASTTAVRASARPVALTRAISCLVDNAVRAAGRHGTVTVSVEATDRVVVTVRDDGPGLGKVPARSSLGLTLTKALVAACDGTFDLRPAPDGGTIARIALPRVRPPAVAS